MGNLLSRLLKLGINQELSPLQYARVLIINWFVMVGVLIACTLLIANLTFGLNTMVIICIASIVTFLPTFYLNATKRFEFAAVYFLSLSIVIVFIGSIAAFSESRFTDTENILFCAMILSVFVFDNQKSALFYLLSFISLICLKTIKTDQLLLPFDSHFALTLIINGIVSFMLFLFANLFKRILLKALKDVNEQQNLLYNLIDNVPLYIGIFNKEGRYCMVNKRYEETFFMKREDIIGKRLRDIIPKKNIPNYEPMLKRALAGEQVAFHLETAMNDGSNIYAHGKYVPVFDKAGDVQYVTVALYDVTDMERVKQQLEAANTAKNRLFNIIAHDIKNPLYNFELILNAQKKDVYLEKDFKRYISHIKSRFSPLKATIHGLLEWSVAQLNGLTTNPKRVSFKEVLNEIIEQLDNDLTHKLVDVKIIGDIQEIYVDEGHLKIILRNLIHNAIKFSPERGTIEIELHNLIGEKTITISDYGQGISDKIVHKILSKEIVESSRGTKGETGAGIGLSFCVELIEKNSGTLEIESEKGKGSAFKIRFKQGING